MNVVDLDKDPPKQRKTPVNYNSKTLAWLRERGYKMAPMEIYNVYSGQKSDGFGFLDWLAIRGPETLGVQGCGLDIAPHIKKITQERRDIVKEWLITRALVLIGWRKLKTGVKAKKFFPRVIDFTLDENGELIWKERI